MTSERLRYLCDSPVIFNLSVTWCVVKFKPVLVLMTNIIYKLGKQIPFWLRDSYSSSIVRPPNQKQQLVYNLVAKNCCVILYGWNVKKIRLSVIPKHRYKRKNTHGKHSQGEKTLENFKTKNVNKMLVGRFAGRKLCAKNGQTFWYNLCRFNHIHK